MKKAILGYLYLMRGTFLTSRRQSRTLRQDNPPEDELRAILDSWADQQDAGFKIARCMTWAATIALAAAVTLQPARDRE